MICQIRFENLGIAHKIWNREIREPIPNLALQFLRFLTQLFEPWFSWGFEHFLINLVFWIPAVRDSVVAQPQDSRSTSRIYFLRYLIVLLSLAKLKEEPPMSFFPGSRFWAPLCTIFCWHGPISVRNHCSNDFSPIWGHANRISCTTEPRIEIREKKRMGGLALQFC